MALTGSSKDQGIKRVVAFVPTWVCDEESLSAVVPFLALKKKRRLLLVTNSYTPTPLMRVMTGKLYVEHHHHSLARLLFTMAGTYVNSGKQFNQEYIASGWGVKFH